MPGRSVAVAVFAAAVAIAAIVIVTSIGSGGTPDVSIVLVHPTIRPGTIDPVVVRNDSSDWLTYGSCGHIGVLPRTNAFFKPPSGVQCLDAIEIRPHSGYRVREGPYGPYEEQIAAEPPGRYWVWFKFYASPNRLGTFEPEHVAYTPLTVVK
jgi:hypothetical protein